ncbi:54S ribosomal protein L23, mitochondrial [Rhizophlyctis rosea]|nr:54S ribosomal protein L23, mitochondrial [Rhizophlyctis rosea]
MTIKTGLTYARLWHHVDAKDKSFLWLAQRISIALRGKYKPIWHESIDVGDYVVVTNARHVGLLPKDEKEHEFNWEYRFDSGWSGGKKTVPFMEYFQKHPTGPLRKAVWAAMPNTDLRPKQMRRLFVFADEDHPYTQNIYRNYEQEAKERFAAKLKAEGLLSQGKRAESQRGVDASPRIEKP